MYHQLTDQFELAADPERVWRFFSTAANLPLITPPWLGFTMAMKTPVTIEQDAVLDYTVRWLGVPIRWRTRIIDWSPPRQFIDLQVRGPYRLWHHQHRFEPTSGGGTSCFDRVIYALPVPLVRRLVHPLLVRRQLMEIFQFRRRAIGQHLGWVRAVQDDVEIRTLE